MDKRLKNAANGFMDRWNQLSFNQKITLGTLLMALVLLVDGLWRHVRGEWTAALVVLLGAVALAGGKAVER